MNLRLVSVHRATLDRKNNIRAPFSNSSGTCRAPRRRGGPRSVSQGRVLLLGSLAPSAAPTCPSDGAIPAAHCITGIIGVSQGARRARAGSGGQGPVKQLEYRIKFPVRAPRPPEPPRPLAAYPSIINSLRQWGTSTARRRRRQRRGGGHRSGEDEVALRGFLNYERTSHGHVHVYLHTTYSREEQDEARTHIQTTIWAGLLIKLDEIPVIKAECEELVAIGDPDPPGLPSCGCRAAGGDRSASRQPAEVTA
ncbi:hypothetical protein E2C01_028499 [Portunus trituberculatus]|uniref:Uncharacterized protein n=1 Tax=Portunus trituberculatus TaxID=210409 RepID=A0A5B7ENS6_PORTR|nr:hypothetical protein [Portunus trituberculatus]